MIVSLSLALLTMQNGPIKVEVRQTDKGYVLLRGGQPYTIKGVGGTGRMDDLVKAGGNSMRTWGTERLGTELDDARNKGITIMAGIWLGHRSYFNYSDPAQVKKQYETVRADVTKYKNHPALLIWGLGNEMEVDNNDTPALWTAIEDLCKLVKSIDPNHPTATVVADFSPEKIANIKKYCPSLDILGVNSYGGLISVPERLKAAGWTKPYVVTEFGPNGPWERPKAPWGAEYEQTSTEKAAKYEKDYKHSIAGQPGWCLGSYAFLWGDKQEGTPTWFGMFLPTGEKTQAVDVMTEMWSGRKPVNGAPRITRTSFSPNANGTFTASIIAEDPNRDQLKYQWSIRYETVQRKRDGQGENTPQLVPGIVDSSTGPNITFRGPAEKNNYRLYVKITDGKGNAAVANFPFQVK